MCNRVRKKKEKEAYSVTKPVTLGYALGYKKSVDISRKTGLRNRVTVVTVFTRLKKIRQFREYFFSLIRLIRLNPYAVHAQARVCACVNMRAFKSLFGYNFFQQEAKRFA